MDTSGGGTKSLDNMQTGGHAIRLQDQVKHHDDIWLTPNSMDSLPPRSQEALQRQYENNRKGRTTVSTLREQVFPELAPANWHTVSGQGDDAHGSELSQQVRKSEWPTPRAACPGSRPNGNGGKILEEEARKSWPTPAAQDGKNGTCPPSQVDRDTLPGAMLREEMWPTARSSAGMNVGVDATVEALKRNGYNSRLEERIAISESGMWPTAKGSPSGPDYARTGREGSGGDDLATSVARKQQGSLNPSWVAQLMGFPGDWLD